MPEYVLEVPINHDLLVRLLRKILNLDVLKFFKSIINVKNLKYS